MILPHNLGTRRGYSMVMEAPPSPVGSLRHFVDDKSQNVDEFMRILRRLRKTYTGLGGRQRKKSRADAQPFCVTESRRRTSLAVFLS